MIAPGQEALAAWFAERTIPNRNRLVCAFAYLCRRAAQRFRSRAADPRDLEQVGIIGLIKACEHYDPGYETPFEAYAWLMVCGEVLHYLRDSEQLLRVPRTLTALERKRIELEGELTHRLQRAPSSEETAAALDQSCARERRIVQRRYGGRAYPTLSFIGDGGADGVLRAPAAAGEQVEDRILLHMALRDLEVRERRIVLLLVRGHTQSEIARVLGYSQRHISRLYRQAMRKMAAFWV